MPTEPERLLQKWKEWKITCDAEVERTIKIIRLLGDLPTGVGIPEPPQIDFEALTNPPSSKGTKNASKIGLKYNTYKWHEKFKEVMQSEDPLGPLYSHRRMMASITKLYPEISNNSDNKSRISTALGEYYNKGKCGRVEVPGGGFKYGDLRYFNDPTTLKNKYAHLGLHGEPQSDSPTHFSALPDLWTPKKEPEKRLTQEQIDNWAWHREIKKFLDEYDPTQNGLPSAKGVAFKMGALNKPILIDAASLSTVNITLGQLYKKGELGRVQSANSKRYLYGPLKYFTNKDTLKKEYDYLVLNTEDDNPIP